MIKGKMIKNCINELSKSGITHYNYMVNVVSVIEYEKVIYTFLYCIYFQYVLRTKFS